MHNDPTLTEQGPGTVNCIPKHDLGREEKAKKNSHCLPNHMSLRNLCFPIWLSTEQLKNSDVLSCPHYPSDTNQKLATNDRTLLERKQARDIYHATGN